MRENELNDLEGFKHCFCINKDFIQDLNEFNLDDFSGELEGCEHNFNNCDPTSGMTCFEGWEIDHYLNLILKEKVERQKKESVKVLE